LPGGVARSCGKSVDLIRELSGRRIASRPLVNVPDRLHPFLETDPPQRRVSGTAIEPA